MISEKEIIIKDLKRRLSNNLKDNLIDVILFGSQLTGNSSADSDYDILIVVKKRNDWKLERMISDICYEVELDYGIITDSHVLTENELNLPRGKQPIFYNAINHGYHAWVKEDDRKILINYRLEQAKETIVVSQFLIDSSQLVVAFNRIYYGMYYAVTALAIKCRFETSKHL